MGEVRLVKKVGSSRVINKTERLSGDGLCRCSFLCRSGVRGLVGVLVRDESEWQSVARPV